MALVYQAWKFGQMPMYVTRHPDDHDQWLENKKNCNTNKSSNESCKSSDSQPSKTLSLANNMRTAMVAIFLMSETEANQLWNKIEDKSKD